ncbi:MAG: hypothetical protein Kow0059_20890 [Candidatus Sumerlaeia bacterium]
MYSDNVQVSTELQPSRKAFAPDGPDHDDFQIIQISQSPDDTGAGDRKTTPEPIFRDPALKALDPGSAEWNAALAGVLIGHLTPAEMSVAGTLFVMQSPVGQEEVEFFCRRWGLGDESECRRIAAELIERLSALALLARVEDAAPEPGDAGDAAAAPPPPRFKFHAVAGRAILGAQSDEERRACHEAAAAWFARPFHTLMQQTFPAVLESASRLWQEKKLSEFPGVTEEDWNRSGGVLPEPQLEALRLACLREIIHTAASRLNPVKAAAGVDAALAMRRHLNAAGRAAEAAAVGEAVLDALERLGRHEEAADILRARAAALDGAARIECLERLAGHLAALKRTDEALTLFQEARTWHSHRHDRDREAAVLERLRELHRQKGALDAALDIQRQLLALEQMRQNLEGCMNAHLEMSNLYMQRGRTGSFKHSIFSRFHIYLTWLHSDSDFAQGVIHTRKAERLARRLGDTHFRAKALHQRGVIMDYYGQTAQAEKCYLKSLELRRLIRDDEGVAESLMEIGKTYLATAHALLVQGKDGPANVFFTRAQRCFFDSIEIYRTLGQNAQVKSLTELMQTTTQALSRGRES